MPARVGEIISVGEFTGSEESEDGDTAANPKSSTLTTPDGVIMMLAGFRSRWTMPFSCAAWLSVSPAAGVTPGNVLITPNAAGLSSGAYSSMINVSVSGAANGLIAIPVTLTVETVTVAAVANAASGATGLVSPGLIVSIFGSGLGPQMGVSATLPLPGSKVAATLGGRQVRFDGIDAPLLYAGDGQVNAVVPFEVGGETSTVMTVTFGGNQSTGATLPVAASAPGLFTADDSGHGQGAIINQDGTVNSASNPAPAGSVVSLFGTGGGQTVTPSTDGEIAAAAPNKLVLATTATVGGQPAQVPYAGWAPTLLAGVMQVNVQIPSGTPSGPATG